MSELQSIVNTLLSTPTAPQARRTREGYPTGWEPGVTIDATGNQVITTGLVNEMSNDKDSWKEAAESLGLKLPEGYTVEMYEARYDPAAWHRDEQGQEAVTRPIWRYKFKVVPVRADAVSYDDLIELIRKHKPGKPLPDCEITNKHWILATGDWQLGKTDGDGYEGTISRILEALDSAILRIAELRKAGKWPGNAVLILTGDCVEGFLSQGGANIWRTNLTMTEQVKLYRRLLTEMIIRLSKVVEKLLVVGVPGNHGETVRVAGKMATRIDDSWDLDAIVTVSEILAQQPELYSHVTFVVPGKDEGEVILDLGGTITAIAHGHQVPGSNVPKWVAENAKNMSPVGDAHLVITGHKHHFKMEPMGPRWWIQVPAMESESTWWKHRTGDVSMPGMVSMIVGDGRWSDLAIL